MSTQNTSRKNQNKPNQPTTIEQQLDNISLILNDVQTYDWKARINALNELKSVAAQINQQNPTQLYLIFSNLQKQLMAQLLDLRSAVMKEATELIISFAQDYHEEFQVHSHRYVSSECLFKLLNNGKKVIVDLAHSCITQIVQNTIQPKLIIQIHEQIDSKNSVVRGKVLEYLDIILTSYEVETLDKNSNFIEDMIQKGLKDASQTVRNQSKVCFKSYKGVLSLKSNKFYLSLEKNLQKLLQNDNESNNSNSNRKSPNLGLSQTKIDKSKERANEYNLEEGLMTPPSLKYQNKSQKYEKSRSQEKHQQYVLTSSRGKSINKQTLNNLNKLDYSRETQNMIIQSIQQQPTALPSPKIINNAENSQNFKARARSQIKSSQNNNNNASLTFDKRKGSVEIATGYQSESNVSTNSMKIKRTKNEILKKNDALSKITTTSTNINERGKKQLAQPHSQYKKNRENSFEKKSTSSMKTNSQMASNTEESDHQQKRYVKHNNYLISNVNHLKKSNKVVHPSRAQNKSLNTPTILQTSTSKKSLITQTTYAETTKDQQDLCYIEQKVVKDEYDEVLTLCRSVKDSDRLHGFCKISEIFNIDKDNMQLPQFETFQNIIRTLIEHMNEDKRDIQQIVLNTLKIIFEFFAETVEVLLPLVIDKIILNISSKKNLLGSYQLFEIIVCKYQSFRLISIFVSTVKTSIYYQMIPYMISSLDLINLIIKKKIGSANQNDLAEILLQTDIVEFLLKTTSEFQQKSIQPFIRTLKQLFEQFMKMCKSEFDEKIKQINETNNELLFKVYPIFTLQQNERTVLQEISNLIKQLNPSIFEPKQAAFLFAPIDPKPNFSDFKKQLLLKANQNRQQSEKDQGLGTSITSREEYTGISKGYQQQHMKSINKSLCGKSSQSNSPKSVHSQQIYNKVQFNLDSELQQEAQIVLRISDQIKQQNDNSTIGEQQKQSKVSQQNSSQNSPKKQQQMQQQEQEKQQQLQSFPDFVKLLKLKQISEQHVIDVLKERNMRYQQYSGFWKQEINNVLLWLGQQLSIQKYQQSSFNLFYEILQNQLTEQIKQTIKAVLERFIKLYLDVKISGTKISKLSVLLYKIQCILGGGTIVLEEIMKMDILSLQIQAKVQVIELIQRILENRLLSSNDYIFIEQLFNKIVLHCLNNQEALLRKGSVLSMVFIKQILTEKQFLTMSSGKLLESQEQLMKIYYSKLFQNNQHTTPVKANHKITPQVVVSSKMSQEIHKMNGGIISSGGGVVGVSNISQSVRTSFDCISSMRNSKEKPQVNQSASIGNSPNQRKKMFRYNNKANQNEEQEV